jgi:hypothetical protein
MMRRAAHGVPAAQASACQWRAIKPLADAISHAAGRPLAERPLGFACA